MIAAALDHASRGGGSKNVPTPTRAAWEQLTDRDNPWAKLGW